MKRYILLIILIAISAATVSAQRQVPKGHWHQEWIVVDGERIPHIHILPVYVFSKGIDKRRYWRLVNAVKVTYPMAQTAKELMSGMEEELPRLKSEKEQKAYINGIYKAIVDEYTPVLKKMTRTQGRVLLRLIDRETEYTAYNIVHEFRGRFLAGFWQGVSKIFGQDLKAEYGQADEDAIIEQIVVYYEAGLL
ncbi:MAG: DUF4294 domain-containing protein [Rikenellaceae bacterium]